MLGAAALSETALSEAPAYPNVWMAPLTTDPREVATSPGTVYFEDGGVVTWGRARKATVGDLVAEYDWTWAGGYLYIYAATDPGTRYDSVEACQRAACVNVNQKDHLVFDGLAAHYGAQDGILAIATPTTRTGMTIQNCVV